MRLPTFVLVHGFAHSASHWCLLIEALARRGAPAVPLDLPCSDPDAGLREYADTVLSKAALLDDVVLVGHSMGGLTISIVAGDRPLRELVYLCAAVPEIGMTAMDQIEADPTLQGAYVRENPLELAIDADGCFRPLPPDVSKAVYYDDCARDIADWAVTQLRRQAKRPVFEVTPLKEWPSVPIRTIYSPDDRVHSPEWVRRLPEGAVHERIRGDHSPFLSRPEELADILVRPYAS